METFIYQIKSAKGIHLEQLYQEITMILNSFKPEEEPSIICNVPSLNSVLLTTINYKLVCNLLSDVDFALTKIK